MITAAAAGVTVGATLTGMMDQVHSVIDHAQNSANAVQMEAGRELYLALQNAQNAYKESLNLTVASVDLQTKKTLSEFASEIHDVEDNTFGSLDQLTTRTQTIVNSLPLAAEEPQVGRVLPSYVAEGRIPSDVRVRYQGNFRFASDPSFGPVLIVDNETLHPVANTTQELEFSVPHGLLHSGRTSPSGVSLLNARLFVPWNQSYAWHLRHRKETDAFATLIGVLPQSPGGITVLHVVPRQDVVTRTFTAGPYQVCSLAECGNNDQLNVPFSISPDAGWTVVRNTSSLNKTWNEGENFETFAGDDGNTVRYNVTTIHKKIGTSGKVIFTISFQEQKVTQGADTIRTVVNGPTSTGLRWGDQISFPYDVGSYKVIFDAFDGAHSEFSAVDNSNKFLKIRDQNGTLVLAAADPATLTWP